MYFLKHKAYLLIGLFCFISSNFYGQDQALADSLIKLYKTGTFKGEELELLRDIAENESNPDINLVYSDILIKKATEDSTFDFLASGYLQKGNAYKIKGDNAKALEAFFKSLEYAKRTNHQKGIGSLFVSIADTYSIMDNSTNADIYYDKGIKILRVVNDSIQLASALLNAGDEYLSVENYDKALLYFDESGTIFKDLNYPIGIAYNKGNLGMVYAELENDSLALKNINEAVTILEELQDYYPISVYLTYMADIYANKNDFDKATAFGHRSLKLAKQYKLKDQISDANLKLYELYNSHGNSTEALNYYKEHILYRDSIKNIESVQLAANMRTEFEVGEKQIIVDSQRKVVIATIIVLLAIGVVAILLLKRNKFMKKTNEIIAHEKQRSDNLLMNILPEETALELKENGKVEAKQFNSVSVLFTDFKGFTSQAENLTPKKLVESINYYFSKFDEIIEKYDLEKIKTIGDAYMCASGLPFPDENHAVKICQAAIEIVDFVNETKRNTSHKLAKFDIRVGINTGTVVAGIVGTKKFQYDIWGDAVNTASRMESSGETGKVNISESTYSILKDYDIFELKPRGAIEAKGKGKVNMYFVSETIKEIS